MVENMLCQINLAEGQGGGNRLSLGFQLKAWAMGMTRHEYTKLLEGN